MIAVPSATNLLTGQGATSVKVENTTGGDNLCPYGSQMNGMGAWFAQFGGDGEARPAPAPAYAAELGYDPERIAAVRASGAVV